MPIATFTYENFRLPLKLYGVVVFAVIKIDDISISSFFKVFKLNQLSKRNVKK